MHDLYELTTCPHSSLWVCRCRMQARVLLEVEETLVAGAAAAATTAASVEEGEEGARGVTAAFEPLASLPTVILRPVPLPTSCW